MKHLTKEQIVLLHQELINSSGLKMTAAVLRLLSGWDDFSAFLLMFSLFTGLGGRLYIQFRCSSYFWCFILLKRLFHNKKKSALQQHKL